MTGSEKSFNILIVEDSKTQALQLAHLLENSGYNVTIVYNADDALEVVRKNKPSLVISDIVMPGMSGYELCAAIRSNDSTSDIPVILLTSLASPQDIISALECGADDFISKPYDEDFLIKKLAKFFSTSALKEEKMNNEKTEEVVYSGRQYRISVSRRKKLDLMISAYEAAIIKNRDLIRTQEALVSTNRQLETTVIEKEKALEEVRIKEELLKKWNSELNIMNLLGAVINSSATLDELLHNAAEEMLNYGFAGARFGVEFVLIDGSGKPSRFYRYRMKDASIIPSESGESDDICADIMNRQQLLTADSRCISPSCHWKDQHGAAGHGHISVLLIARDRKIGVLELITLEKYNPGEHVDEMLVSLGEQLGMAVENHNLFSETTRLSLHDPLTGLPNRRMIDITLATQMARAKRYSTLFCLIILDIDHFKQYNDNFGHDEGDRILKALSSYLKENIRDTDLAARFGGEEFLVILSEIGIKDVFKIAERHRQLIQEQVGITVSMGIAEYKTGQTGTEIIKSADKALYRAKENGRNRIETAK